jgi:hypothetical protein
MGLNGAGEHDALQRNEFAAHDLRPFRPSPLRLRESAEMIGELTREFADRERNVP